MSCPKVNTEYHKYVGLFNLLKTIERTKIQSSFVIFEGIADDGISTLQC